MNVPRRLSSLGRMTTLASRAGPLARALLQEPLPRRWAHVQGVAARACTLAPALGADADLLEAAAWLHDTGYAPGLATKGLHAQHAGAKLCQLVAHHSCAIIEAAERGLAGVLGREFEPPPDVLREGVDRAQVNASLSGVGASCSSVQSGPGRPRRTCTVPSADEWTAMTSMLDPKGSWVSVRPVNGFQTRMVAWCAVITTSRGCSSGGGDGP